MAMKYLDMTGKTEEEAVSKALAELGLDRDDVSVEILERAKKGLFGIGASPAKVRVTYGLEDPDPVREVSAPAAQPSRGAPEKRPAPEVREIREEAPAASAPVPERRERSERPERRRRRAGENRPRPEQRRDEERTEDVPLPPPVDLGEPCGDNDEKAVQIRTFLTGLLEHMNSTAVINIYQPEKGRYKVFLEGEKMGQLIGRRGETLDAIQQLANYAVNRGADKRVRIHVDAENYRLKREQSLQKLALKVAGKVIRYKRSVPLEPMNAYERHVIHTALQNVENITTYSMGTDPNRRVIVAYDREKRNQEQA